jgi:2-isopropylmalate synthase
LKNPLTYEIMTPESVGRKATDMVIASIPAVHAIKAKLRNWATPWTSSSLPWSSPP